MSRRVAQSAETTFVIDDVTFLIGHGPRAPRQTSDRDRFVLCKNDQQIEFYRALSKHRPRDILEIGMYEGGSLVLWDKLFAPRCLVGIDFRATPVAALESYRADRPHIRTYYARSQDKPGTLMAARENFPSGIDLLIDDASHHYPETKATFENLFPMVRPGGFYIIENWAWSHQAGAQAPTHPWRDRPALTNLLFELTVLAATNNGIQSIHIDAGVVAIRKGKGALPAGGVTVDRGLRGRNLPRI